MISIKEIFLSTFNDDGSTIKTSNKDNKIDIHGTKTQKS